MNKNEIINTKVITIKEELSKWENELLNSFSLNLFKPEYLFLISDYWIVKYKKYISDKNNINPTFEEKYNIVNNDSLSIIFDTEVSIKDLPKVFVLNKNNWDLIQKENSQVYIMMISGTFLDNLLLLNLSEKIYCFFFVYKKSKKNQLRQGYIEIKNKKDEPLIMHNIKRKGILYIIEKNNKEINDNEICIENKDYIIIIKENIENHEQMKKIIKKYKDLKKSIKEIFKEGKRKLSDVKNKIVNKIKINAIEKMGKLKRAFKKEKKTNNLKNSLINTNKELNINKDKEIITLDMKSLANIEEEKILKENLKKREHSAQNRDRKFNERKSILMDDDFDISDFCPVKVVEKQSSPGIIGLVNIGATCYMNATLQCFSNVTRLRKELLNKTVYNNLENNKEKNKQLSFALAEVLKNLWENLKQRFYSPDNFKEVISKMNPLFKGIAANDPKDLILFLLETMHKELNMPPNIEIKNNDFVNNNNFIDVFNNYQKEYTNKNKSIISEEFYGYANSLSTCGKCNTTIHNVQSINILFFPLEEVRKFKGYNFNVIRINECFEYYEKQEIFPSFYCNNCKSMSEVYNQSKIVYAPKTLIINLNRGKGLQYDINIIFEEYLNLKNFIFFQDSPYYYELTGVICHFGSNDDGGHFIAFCKNCNNCEWYKYNDQMVTRCSFNEVLRSGLPYVLFYSYVNV